MGAHNPVVDVAQLELAHVDLLSGAEALPGVHLIRDAQQGVLVVGPRVAGQEHRLEQPGALRQSYPLIRTQKGQHPAL